MPKIICGTKTNFSPQRRSNLAILTPPSDPQDDHKIKITKNDVLISWWPLLPFGMKFERTSIPK
jgi:hypothetical protein